MSDYSRQQDFNAKTGTTIFGSDVDSEFDALVTAVNSKVDESREGAANGIPTLDAGALIPAGISGLATSGGGQMPEASLTALGAVELATTSEATTLTDALRVITPDTLDDVLSANGGIAKDLQAMAAPGTDTILGYDLTAGAAIGYTVGAGLETALTVLQIDDATVSGTGITATSGVFALDFLGLEALVDPNQDALYGWDDTAGTSVWFQALDGLEFTNATGSIGLVDVAAGAAQPITITAGTFSVDLSSLTELVTATGLAATDRVYIDDAGTPKAVEIQEMGLRVQTAQATQTLAAADMNSIMQFNATATLTLPLNATTALPVGVPVVLNMIHATQVLTVTADTGVTLVSTFHPAGTAAASDILRAGGTALLYKTAADTWCLTGDTSDA